MDQPRRTTRRRGRAPLSPKKIIDSIRNRLSPVKSPIRKKYAAGASDNDRPFAQPSPSTLKMSSAMRKLNLENRPPSCAATATAPPGPPSPRGSPSRIPWRKRSGDTSVHHTILTTPPRKELAVASPETTPESVSGVDESPLNSTFVLKRLANPLAPEIRDAYRQIKKCLTTERTEAVIGRTQEQLEITNSINRALDSGHGTALYISGNPGTGKTACIYSLQSSNSLGITLTIVNCMDACGGSINKFYLNVLTACMGPLKKPPKTTRGLQQRLEREFSKRQYFIVLDEIDRLAGASSTVGNLSSGSTTSISSTTSKKSSQLRRAQTPEQQVLCWLFMQAAQTKLVLIAIANTLDFTERAVPELYELLEKKHRPKLLNFKPYDQKELTLIVKDRLKLCPRADEILPTSVVMYTAMKIGKQFGDVRRVFDVLKRTVEFVEMQAKKAEKLLKVTVADINRVHNANTNDFLAAAAKTLTPKKSLFGKKRGATPAVPSLLLQSVNGAKVGDMDSSDDDDGGLPVQQALLLCAIFKVIRKMERKEVEFTLVKSSYSEACESCGIGALHESELITLLNALEDQSYIGCKGRTSGLAALKKCKIRLNVDEKDVKSAFQDRSLLSKLF